MGVNVESTLDVEESTEPPICGYTEPSSKPNVASTLDIRPYATDEKSISHKSHHPAPSIYLLIERTLIRVPTS